MLTSKRRVKPVESVTTGLSRNTASSLAKKVVNVPKRALSRKPSMNNMRRKSTVDPVKTPVSPETSQSPEACFKRLSEQTLHDHNCEQTYRHICAGCDRNVAVQETSSSSTSSRQKLKSTSSSSTTATHTEDMSPSKKLKPQEDWIVAPQEEWKSEENKQVWKEEWKPTENKQVEWKSAENKQVEWKSAENKQVEWKFTEIKQENRVELTKDSDQEKRERDEEERWKESFLKQQERMLATLLVHHHHMNDIELMHLQSQVIQLKSHTNTTLDHILDVQSNLLNKVSLLLNPPAPEPLLEPAPLLESVPDWQTKVAFDLARFKWGLNQWFGNLVGIGEMDNQEYDRFGYTNDVVISGIAVTIEPALLPKV
ncbi:hypothetical protein CU098_009022 [Rhizopus stolonifer]|uniref:Uncharacterized protein n=1 Tax=Rhizopus stolonifer TaxID=4846 RepID=A0A367JDA3_RHIST|nr:hypothetical protein CU098_009022 [Rhizopus stolonifer]